MLITKINDALQNFDCFCSIFTIVYLCGSVTHSNVYDKVVFYYCTDIYSRNILFSWPTDFYYSNLRFFWKKKYKNYRTGDVGVIKEFHNNDLPLANAEQSNELNTSQPIIVDAPLISSAKALTTYNILIIANEIEFSFLC